MPNHLFPEDPVVFECQKDRLIGIITRPANPQTIGVVIIVGGPQYRAGSHRQFTLLARRLAQEGFTSIRFDYRGMGDSEGEFRNFEVIDDDIRAAVDTLLATSPGVKKVALWGLCDAASAALYYAHNDPRIVGQVLLNPWVHSPAGEAKARLKHYYLKRLMQKSFWIKLLTGGIKVSQSVGELKQSAQTANASASNMSLPPLDPRHGSPGYIDRMLSGLKAFKGRAHIILSGEDLVAREFLQRSKDDKAWKKALRAATQSQVTKANHTFSTAQWRTEAENQTLAWLGQLRVE